MGILIVNWNFGLKARNFDEEKTTTSSPRSNNHPRAGNFDWGAIEVISEPIAGQNINTGVSDYPSIAVENGKIYVMWSDVNNTNGAGNLDRDISFRCNLTGSSWEPVQVISEPVVGSNTNTSNSNYGKIAVENGKIYAVWSDANDTNGAGV